MKKIFFFFIALLFISIAQAQNIPRIDPNAANLPVAANNAIALVTPAIPSVTIVNEPCPPLYNQIWMQKNLNITTYRNGDHIPEVKDSVEWAKLTTGAWCYYNNDPANGKIYGKLYNWYAVNDPRGLAPEGWHIPSNEEWTAMSNGLGGDRVAGGKMKDLHSGYSTPKGYIYYWLSPNVDASNTSGFNGLPGGMHSYLPAAGFDGIGKFGFWWSSTGNSSPPVAYAWYRTLYNSYGVTDGKNDNGRFGFSVRCVKD
jgi:uncharacterized protein (TIGR02145 family)